MKQFFSLCNSLKLESKNSSSLFVNCRVFSSSHFLLQLLLLVHMLFNLLEEVEDDLEEEDLDEEAKDEDEVKVEEEGKEGKEVKEGKKGKEGEEGENDEDDENDFVSFKELKEAGEISSDEWANLKVEDLKKDNENIDSDDSPVDSDLENIDEETFAKIVDEVNKVHFDSEE